MAEKSNREHHENVPIDFSTFADDKRLTAEINRRVYLLICGRPHRTFIEYPKNPPRLGRCLTFGRGMVWVPLIRSRWVRGNDAGFVGDDGAAGGLAPAAAFVDTTEGANGFDDVAGGGGDGFGLLHDVGEGVFGFGGAYFE